MVIFGKHSEAWMEALAASAAVWNGVPGLRRVLHIEPTQEIPKNKSPWERTVVIPLMEPHIERRPARFLALCPSGQALAILRDKAAFAVYVKSQNLADRCPDVYCSLEEASFPCVIKRTDLNAGNGISIVSSLEEAETLLAKAPFLGKAHIIQSLVPLTREYVAHCVCKAGFILWHCVYAYDHNREKIIRRPANQMTPQRVEVAAALIAELEKFLLPPAFAGPCNIDYTIGADGKLIVFEINPRLGGSLMRQENQGELRDALTCIVSHER